MQPGGFHIGTESAKAVHQHEGFYRVGASGLDSIFLQLSAGPSEPLRPLGLVASGGESSRIMLSLKAAPVRAAQQHQLNAATDGEVACLTAR